MAGFLSLWRPCLIHLQGWKWLFCTHVHAALSALEDSCNWPRVQSLPYGCTYCRLCFWRLTQVWGCDGPAQFSLEQSGPNSSVRPPGDHVLAWTFRRPVTLCNILFCATSWRALGRASGCWRPDLCIVVARFPGRELAQLDSPHFSG